jgi:hypothetical protein
MPLVAFFVGNLPSALSSAGATPRVPLPVCQLSTNMLVYWRPVLAFGSVVLAICCEIEFVLRAQTRFHAFPASLGSRLSSVSLKQCLAYFALGNVARVAWIVGTITRWFSFNHYIVSVWHGMALHAWHGLLARSRAASVSTKSAVCTKLVCIGWNSCICTSKGDLFTIKCVIRFYESPFSGIMCRASLSKEDLIG